MPVLVNDYSWNQSNEIISIRVPLKGKHPCKVDILISDSYIKLHYPPFLFEIFLRHPIIESESECKYTEEEALLTLIKADQGIWDKLEADINKKEKTHQKLKIIEGIQEKTRKHLDEKIKLKSELDRFAVREAIELDTQRRKKIDNLRNLERETAMKDLEIWRQSKRENNSKEYNHITGDNQGVVLTEIPNDDEDTTISKETTDALKKSKLRNCFVSKDKPTENINRKPKKSEFYSKVLTDIETKVIPAPRETQTLNVSFTERVFPTPIRESNSRNEEIWLKNVREARKATGFVSEDLRPEEQEPQWCKDKGDSFFKMGNYLGAISAYSHGIKLSDKLPSLYANRSACHFAIGNFNKCIEDCSSALDLLKPPCDLNLESRVKCISRRGAALTRIGMLRRGIEEMKSALRLQPGNEKIKADLHCMERAWEQDPDSD